MVLVDTSIWIEVFRKTEPLDLEAYVDFGAITTCPPVVQEVLAGIRDARAFRLARDAMLALPIVDARLEVDRFLQAAALYREARQRGITPRSHVDCLIAAIACAHDLEVLHRDRDFAALALTSPLRQRSI